jgi:NAD(P)-dependent dehydrogenase (short-subunit alcohol dehydrogenase family)
VLSLTRSIAREFGHLGIRANAICPAMIQPPMLDGLSAERLQGIIDAIPLRRTGATIDVNGGPHIH